MKLIVNKDRSTTAVGTWGTKNENDYEILEFEFPTELEEYNKRIVYYLGNTRVWDTIVDNKAYITNAITQYSKVKAYVWLTKENTEREADTDFRTKLFEMKFFKNENADGIVPTEQQVDGFNTMLTQMSNAINEIDDKIDEADAKIQQIDEAITGVENLNIDVSDKVDGDVTVTLTKKDNTTKTVVLSDGTSLEFMWEGTSLGIKTEDDTEYTYVDLQGVQGPVGPKGDAFVIKKTYSSVAEMNADFNNMQVGDYVMIASTVELEDNAKLYTKGEQAWIFISDFSGAQGIKGETGATPNIQIGTVVSGSTPNVTRTGTNENPVLNFTLVPGEKGDKGDTGDTGATGNGIASIDKTSTVGYVDTYTITYTNGNTTTFTVTNGEVTQQMLDNTVAELQQEIDELSENMPWDETTQATEIQVTDAAKYSRNKLELFGNTEQATSILPDTYTQVDYIESAGAGYIDTGVNADSNLSLEMDYEFTDISSQDKIYLGAIYNPSETSYTRYHSALSSNNLCFILRGTGTDVGTIDTNKHKWFISQEKFIFDGTEILPVDIQTFDTTINFWLMGRNSNNNSLKKYAYMKLYRCKMWYSNTLVRDFVPCYRNSDNEVGLYDIVNNIFYPNEGTGTFTYGAVAAIPNPDYPQDIHVVSGNNTIEVQGKNLLDVNNTTNGYINDAGQAVALTAVTNRLTDYIEFSNSITISLDTTIYGIGYALFDENKNYLSRVGRIADIDKHTISDNSAKYIRIWFNYDNSNPTTTELLLQLKAMIEKGTQSTTYEPYYHVEYPLNLGDIELCKIGNVQDYLYKENGNWYKYGAIRKYTTPISSTLLENGKCRVVLKNRSSLHDMSSSTNVFTEGKSKHAIVTQTIENTTIRYNYGWGGLTVLYSLEDSTKIKEIGNIETTYDLRDWFSANEIIYAVIDQTYDYIDITQITDTTLISQLDAIYEHLQLQKGINNITVTPGDIAPYMKLNYMQDLPSKLNAIESRISALEE